MDEERQNQPEGQPPPMAQVASEPPPPKTSGMAVASLVLGILALFTCVTSLPGLILGIIALVQISRNPGRLRGQGMALAGTIISGLAVLLVPILAAILFPVFARARDAAIQTSCLNNVKQLSMAVQMYKTDWDNSYPLAENWNEAIGEYVRPSVAQKSSSKLSGVWVCPAAKSKEPAYALNEMLAGVSEKDVNFPAETVGIYESLPGRNQVGGATLLPSPPRHHGGNSIGFADGHVKSVDAHETGGLVWDPKTTTVPQATTTPEEPKPTSG
jgi:prepilin-type processing-associated H-X9-DG protein